MVSVAAAKQLIEANTFVLPNVTLTLEAASGLVLAKDLYAPSDVPFFHQSAMDGYAFAFDKWQNNELPIVGEIAAGRSDLPLLDGSQAMRIFTGAAVPDGADTVVMQEKTTTQNSTLTITDERLQKGGNVRLKGSEIRAGELALQTGTRLTPAAIGFMAGMGIDQLEVYKPVKVSLVVTGNELQKPGAVLPFGHVYESNSFALKAVLKQLHIEEVAVHYAIDELASVVKAIEAAAANADLVLLTGGISVGDYDYVLQALTAFGVEKLFHKVKQKPGKPLYFGKKGTQLFFGLPGNPASVLTCFYEYVLPALGKLSANAITSMPATKATLTHRFQKNQGLTYFMKGIYDNEKVTPCDAQESYRMSSFATANCLICLEENETIYEPGSTVEIHLLPM